MSSSAFPRRHPTSVTLRPEREYYSLSWLDRWLRKGYRWLGWPLRRVLLWQGRTARQVIARSEQLAQMSDVEFRQHIVEIKQRLQRQGICAQTLVPAFAMVREAAGRSLGMRHHHTQIRASLVLLRGMVAEMATGEGKTLASTLASVTAALAGVKVHVVTTNDYLAQRDCEEMAPLFKFLGLSSGALVNECELAERQQIYASDILYCCNNELVFDYLKDSLVLDERRDSVDVYRDLVDGDCSFTRRLMHRGLVFAIVDEADSVFIDESRTPLVISGGELPMADSEDFLRAIMDLCRNLEENTHYLVDLQFRRIILLAEGRHKLDERKEAGDDLSWHQRARGEELMLRALSALHLYHRDKHYIVADDKVMIVDEYTGRLSPDRSWEGGLHQLIEIKEGCELTEPQRTLSKISYQQFFRKYFYLSGMTGTAREVRSEFYSVYGLLVNRVPLLRRSRRKTVGCRVLATQTKKLQAVVAAVRRRVEEGRAVLVGTASVEQSEQLAAGLQQAGIHYELLTAKQDENEAAVVARAGQPGRVTIATSMAGRGTDIKLADATREAGGLHVIICELQDAGRIDRQLEGRCARQGDPGSVEYILSYEDPLIVSYGLGIYRLGLPLFRMPWLGSWFGRQLQRHCQRRLEQKHARERYLTLKGDERERTMLAFLGGGKWR